MLFIFQNNNNNEIFLFTSIKELHLIFVYALYRKYLINTHKIIIQLMQLAKF
jgi:hypothetical protein